MKIIASEFDKLAEISQKLGPEYVGSQQEKEWGESPFAWIRFRPSRQKGAIGEKLVEGWLAAYAFEVLRSPDSDADRVIEGKRAEIKFSTLWKGGIYKFQQLRDQAYEFVICLGISPHTAHCWVIPKEDIIRLWKEEGKISSQHGGKSGSDTGWITVSPDKPPEWLIPFGGSLSEGLSVLSRITGSEAE